MLNISQGFCHVLYFITMIVELFKLFSSEIKRWPILFQMILKCSFKNCHKINAAIYKQLDRTFGINTNKNSHIVLDRRFICLWIALEIEIKKIQQTHNYFTLSFYITYFQSLTKKFCSMVLNMLPMLI